MPATVLSVTTVGILVYDGVDLLDAGGPYEVFLTAARLAARAGEEPPFEVLTIGLERSRTAAYGGLGLVPAADAADVARLDVLVVPGTIDVDAALSDASLVAAVRRLAERSELVASVCTGAFLLAEAGLLAGRRWTTHWEDVDLLAARIGHEGATRDVRWVDASDVVTGAGLSSGIAMALHLVDRLAGRPLAEATARQLDHDWDPDGARGA